MEGHRPAIIALSLMLAGACGPGRAVTAADGQATPAPEAKLDGPLWLRATTINITGIVSATGGAGGTTTVGPTCGLGGSGGKGSDGRIRVDAVTFKGPTTPKAYLGTAFCRGAPCE
jgi:hypothetical protein